MPVKTKPKPKALVDVSIVNKAIYFGEYFNHEPRDFVKNPFKYSELKQGKKTVDHRDVERFVAAAVTETIGADKFAAFVLNGLNQDLVEFEKHNSLETGLRRALKKARRELRGAFAEGKVAYHDLPKIELEVIFAATKETEIYKNIRDLWTAVSPSEYQVAGYISRLAVPGVSNWTAGAMFMNELLETEFEELPPVPKSEESEELLLMKAEFVKMSSDMAVLKRAIRGRLGLPEGYRPERGRSRYLQIGSSEIRIGMDPLDVLFED